MADLNDQINRVIRTSSECYTSVCTVQVTLNFCNFCKFNLCAFTWQKKCLIFKERVEMGEGVWWGEILGIPPAMCFHYMQFWIYVLTPKCNPSINWESPVLQLHVWISHHRPNVKIFLTAGGSFSMKRVLTTIFPDTCVFYVQKLFDLEKKIKYEIIHLYPKTVQPPKRETTWYFCVWYLNLHWWKLSANYDILEMLMSWITSSSARGRTLHKDLLLEAPLSLPAVLSHLIQSFLPV